MTTRKLERGLAITIISLTIVSAVLGTVLTTISIFYPEIFSDLFNLT